MDIVNQYIPNFLFVLLRAGIMVSMLPFLSSNNIPSKVKIGIAVTIALILAPVVTYTFERADIPLIVLREIIFGMALGFAGRLVFFAVDMGGQLMSVSTGLSMGSVFNPDMGQSTDISTLYGIIAMLIFLVTDAHHDLITIFIQSYTWLPVGSFDVRNLLLPIIGLGSKLFVIALKVAAPVVVLILIANLLLGFVYKAAPQINIFFVAYPVYIVLGFIVMLLSVPLFITVMNSYFSGIKDDMLKAISAAGG
ncbi:MAG: flagellar biosynthetic protein FliR [Nitrospirota bacterium]